MLGDCGSAIDLRYLLEHGTADVYDGPRPRLPAARQGVTRPHQREGKNTRGTVVPMEYGMLEGVERSFRVAGVELDSTPLVAQAVGLEDRYAPSSASSNDAHGAWQELHQHHLAVQPDGRFLPKPDLRGYLSAERPLEPGRPLRTGVTHEAPLGTVDMRFLSMLDRCVDPSRRPSDAFRPPQSGARRRTGKHARDATGDGLPCPPEEDGPHVALVPVSRPGQGCAVRFGGRVRDRGRLGARRTAG